MPANVATIETSVNEKVAKCAISPDRDFRNYGGMTNDWLIKALAASGAKQIDLARAMGLTPDKMSKVINGQRRISDAEGQKARAFLQGKLRLVGTFDPDMIATDEPFSAEAPDPVDPDAPPKIPLGGVIEVDVRAGMGAGGQLQHTYRRDGDEIETIDAVKPEAWMFPTWFMQSVLRAKPSDLLAVETQGDSMEPTIDPGAVVFVDTRHTRPSPDGVYAIRDRWGQIQVKRLESFGEHSANIRIVSDKDGRAISLPLEDVTIVGKVIAAWRRL